MGTTCSSIQEYVLELRKDLPPADAPDYKEKQQEFISRLTAEYTSKPEYWLRFTKIFVKHFFRYCKSNLNTDRFRRCIATKLDVCQTLIKKIYICTDREENFG